MPCSRNRDLPFSQLHQLPLAAREIYQSAYSKAQLIYGANGKQANLDEIAHDVALASLEAGYHKTPQGRWVAD